MNASIVSRARQTFALYAVVFLTVFAAHAADISGKVVGVTDGDTITVLSEQKEQYRIRLFGIDSPESNQAFGSRAKQFTSEQCFGKTVTLRDKGKDRYGRTIGEVILPGATNLNLAILRNGFAWWYREYAPKEKEYESAEAEAKTAKRGLWADNNPVAPWDFRRGKGVDSAKPQTGEEKALSHWLTISSGKRHNSACRYFKNSNGKLCGPNEGVACKVCGG